jgi:glycine/D-amino acid oxidase-like deaminating enzyme
MNIPHGPGLVFGKDITALPTPLKAPGAKSPHILVIGGGVSGLVNAWVLLDAGYHVTIVSKEWATYGTAQRLTCQIAGALWEYPPAVCGQHTDVISLQHSKRWAMTAYHIWSAIATHTKLGKEAGVRMRKADFFFSIPLEECPAQLSKMHEIMAQNIHGFRRDTGIIKEHGINPSYGVVDAYEYLAPVIDTDACMSFLHSLVTAKGAKLVTQTITGDLFPQESFLRAEFAANAIINCTGLSGTELANDDSCYPIRGALIRVINDGSAFPKLEHALAVPVIRDDALSEMVFLLPRNDNILLIGGTTEPHAGTLDLTVDSPIIKRMRERCEAFLPGLANARLDSEYPFAQGLRPFRQKNVRVERELREHAGGQVSRIVHCYGHGGSGWSLSFGCAGDVLGLVKEALMDKTPKPMSGGMAWVELREEARL